MPRRRAYASSASTRRTRPGEFARRADVQRGFGELDASRPGRRRDHRQPGRHEIEHLDVGAGPGEHRIDRDVRRAEVIAPGRVVDDAGDVHVGDPSPGECGPIDRGPDTAADRKADVRQCGCQFRADEVRRFLVRWIQAAEENRERLICPAPTGASCRGAPTRVVARRRTFHSASRGTCRMGSRRGDETGLDRRASRSARDRPGGTDHARRQCRSSRCAGRSRCRRAAGIAARSRRCGRRRRRAAHACRAHRR